MHHPINSCRICGNKHFESIINLGIQSLTGVFPKTREEKITQGSLELIKCSTERDPNACGLVQLRHSYEGKEMYGENYGYRSGLNSSMVKHLEEVVKKSMEVVDLKENDLIIDIASNDGTLLKFYPKGLELVGIDPTASKFSKYYEEHIKIIPEFFSASIIEKAFPDKKARIITSIAMFYDLEDPKVFVDEIGRVLADDGIWVFEQSYLPLMIERNAYDTICHEHIEYYGLKQIKWLLDHGGLKIIDLEINDTNGGSIKVVACKASSPYPECSSIINQLLLDEGKYDSMKVFIDFRNRIHKHKEELLEYLNKLKKANLKIIGYGASTKGNVILQFCGITEREIPFIAEVNEEKFGRFTPGTNIPIVSEKEAMVMNPDCFLVLPWHFKENILFRESVFLNSGGKFLFPLPKIELIQK